MAAFDSNHPASDRDRQSLIAWAGWQMPVPENWRPLKLEGGHAKGSMMIGDAERPVMLVQWWRPGRAAVFDAEKWLERRYRKLGAVPTRDAPAPAGFTRTAWTRELTMRKGGSKTIWSGYAAEAGLLLEVIVTSLTEEPLRAAIFASLVPKINVSVRDKPCCWSMYSVSFMSPPGFELNKRHLFSGDVALQFSRGRKETLLMRQVYPAGLALSRRNLARWLESAPFGERRRLRAPVRVAWRRDAPRELEGIRQSGWKRLPSPLGRCAPRHSVAVAAVDKELDRLLIAERQNRRDDGGAEVDWVVESMNADHGTGGKG